MSLIRNANSDLDPEFTGVAASYLALNGRFDVRPLREWQGR